MFLQLDPSYSVIFFFPTDEVQVVQDSKRIKICWRIQSCKNSISRCTNTQKYFWDLRYIFSLFQISLDNNNIAKANCHKKVTINCHFALKSTWFLDLSPFNNFAYVELSQLVNEMYYMFISRRGVCKYRITWYLVDVGRKGNKE